MRRRALAIAIVALAACAKPREEARAAPEDANVATTPASSPSVVVPAASEDPPKGAGAGLAGIGGPQPPPPPNEIAVAVDGGGVHAAKVPPNQWRFKACYNKNLIGNPTAAGIISLAVAVDGTGHADASVVSTTAPATLTECCRGSFAATRFEAGAPTIFNVKLTLALKR